jgi:hypothetical protein
MQLLYLCLNVYDVEMMKDEDDVECYRIEK